MEYVPETDPNISFAQTPTINGHTLYFYIASRARVSGGSAQKLFSSLDDKYLGTDTLKEHAPINHLAPTDKGAVSVVYGSNNGDFTIMFKWDGSKLLLNPPFPVSYKDWGNNK